MDNYVQPGHSIEYSNSGSAIASGAVVAVLDRCGIALTDIAATTGVGTVNLSGVYTLTKDNDEAIAQGEMLYFDASDSTVTKTAAGNTPIGVAHEAATETSTSMKVRLCEHPKRAAVVAYTAGTNLVGVDGAGSNAAPLTGTETRLDAIDTAIAAIITSLKNAGLMKNA